MKRTVIFFLVLCVIAAVAAPALIASKIQLPPVTDKVLPNGLKVIVIENHEQPVVSMRLLTRSGTCMDNEGKAGLANLTAGLLRKGTATRSANQISEEIDFIGGSLSASAELDATYATCEVLTRHFEVGMTLLSDMILYPTFPDDEIERLRRQLIAALLQQKDDPNSLVAQQYALQLFANHPYAQPSNGTVESVSGITRDDIEGFWRNYYLPNNSVLFIAGNITPEVAFPLAEEKFGGWRQGHLPELSFPEPPQVVGTKIVLINKPDATQSSIKIGHLGIDRYNPDAYSVRLMNYILGGGGFVSRLMSDVREKRGLTYDINSQFTYNRFRGEFTVTTFTRTDSTSEAIHAAIDHLRQIRGVGVTEQELKETKSFYHGYFPRTFETPNQVANQFSIVELYGLGLDYLTNYLDNVSKVTAGDIHEAAKKYVDPDNLLIVVVGQASALREELKQIAPVEEYELIDL